MSVFLGELYKRLEADLTQQTEAYYYQEQKVQQNELTSHNNKNITKACVLLVEDSKIIRKVNLDYLQGLGCSVDTAEDGKQALDLLQNKYDLILLDIGLPDIDGLEICKWIRSHGIETPVIFLTAYGEGVREECKLVGGNDFATKPLSMEKFQKLISEWLPVNNQEKEHISSIKYKV